MRDGYYAGWHGVEYEASPDGEVVRLYSGEPADGFTQVRQDRYLRVVPAHEVDFVGYVKTVCIWRGEPFQVLGEHEDWVRVEYTGGQATVAERLGLERYDRGVYQAWAPRAELQAIREEHH